MGKSSKSRQILTFGLPFSFILYHPGKKQPIVISRESPPTSPGLTPTGKLRKADSGLPGAEPVAKSYIREARGAVSDSRSDPSCCKQKIDCMYLKWEHTASCIPDGCSIPVVDVSTMAAPAPPAIAKKRINAAAYIIFLFIVTPS